MVVMTPREPRETWTDQRLDDLSKRVDDGFARIDGDIRELRAQVKAQGDSLRKEIKSQSDGLRAEMNAQGDSLRAEMNARFDAANRNLIAFAVAIVAAVIGSNAFF